MYWDNRIFRRVKDGQVVYGLHETFYERKGKGEEMIGYTEESEIGYFETPDELLQTLGHMYKDANRTKDAILDYEDWRKHLSVKRKDK